MSPPVRVEQRLGELRGSGKAELIDALEHQLAVQRTIDRQLQRFYDEMERMVVELDTIRGSLVSLSASTDAADQRLIAADVRMLRDELGALASSATSSRASAPRLRWSRRPTRCTCRRALRC